MIMDTWVIDIFRFLSVEQKEAEESCYVSQTRVNELGESLHTVWVSDATVWWASGQTKWWRNCSVIWKMPTSSLKLPDREVHVCSYCLGIHCTLLLTVGRWSFDVRRCFEGALSNSCHNKLTVKVWNDFDSGVESRWHSQWPFGFIDYNVQEALVLR